MLEMFKRLFIFFFWGFVSLRILFFWFIVVLFIYCFDFFGGCFLVVGGIVDGGFGSCFVDVVLGWSLGWVVGVVE